MMRSTIVLFFFSLGVVFGRQPAYGEPSAEMLARHAIDQGQLKAIKKKPLYEFNESEVDLYVRYLQLAEPNLRHRIARIARKNLGQPYELYLLGEMPFEHYDPQPLYCLGKSDCVVYVEHTYAMALAHDWPSFMTLLQRIRYRDGKIGVATRNHFTEADWNKSNRWLVEDITAKIAGEQAVRFRQRVDRAKFFEKRYGLKVDLPVEMHEDIFLPADKIERAKPHLKEGDFVNIVRGSRDPNAKPNATFGGNAFVGHVGLVVRSEESTLRLIHSSKPAVREQTFEDYIRRSNEKGAKDASTGKPRLLGFKFLRLTNDPLKNLQKIDGPEAPRVTLPKGGRASF